MKIERIAAFSDGQSGGNPAGVVVTEQPLELGEMQRVAADVNYSETVFAHHEGPSSKIWRVRYFSPETEVPFCGHATIALGAALARRFGTDRYELILNSARITVDGRREAGQCSATLRSPPTSNGLATEHETDEAMSLFGFDTDDLDARLPVARIHGGADHLMLALKDREVLRRMSYDLDEGRRMMREHGFVTIMLVYVDAERRFTVRNAFASGGVLEDPATGAAAAAFAGLLRDQSWPHGDEFTIVQGEDMGARSLITVSYPDPSDRSVFVHGLTHLI
ncbi:MAG: PhzF family phenazine biosynthesis protein [Pseudomonadota bacterium]